MENETDELLGLGIENQLESMEQYENSVINQIESISENNDLSPAEIHAKIKELKKNLKKAENSGNKKQAKTLKKQIDDYTRQLQLSKDFNVEIAKNSTISSTENISATSLPSSLSDSQTGPSDLLSSQTDNVQTVDEDLTGYWHYDVLNGTIDLDLVADDSDENVYQNRQDYIKDHCRPYITYHNFNSGLQIPLPIWQSLYKHQQEAIEWLWNLWQEKAGGIEGDEMGLGKTVIVASFLHSLIQSRVLSKPILILCPLTVVQQWVREIHIWCPFTKTFLLHTPRSNPEMSDQDILEAASDHPSIVVTNYDTIIKYHETMELHLVDWGVIICDEAHKIRNPKSTITELVKRLPSDFRLAVTGSPIQNSLMELWSIFDFALPGKLGFYDDFEDLFAKPIKAGGYSNATGKQVITAYKQAVHLRDLIRPYLLRRMKKDVKANLPAKTEQVFFVELTKIQTQCYLEFTKSAFCRRIIETNGFSKETITSDRNPLFAGIDALRKICNHPSIYDPKIPEDLEYSAKLVLIKKLLPIWKSYNHRCLLFSQSKKMLDFISVLLDELGLDYFRMDGDTLPQLRQGLIDRFNSGEKFACVLSTKVGGVGVNLIGADKVLIIDPDWNPANDNQALERAWRIGQKKQVSVYRLISRGTIEEKIYRKQIFKQFLNDKILQNPNQRRLFSKTTIRDLFRLGDNNDIITRLSETKQDLEKAEKEKSHQNPPKLEKDTSNSNLNLKQESNINSNINNSNINSNINNSNINSNINNSNRDNENEEDEIRSWFNVENDQNQNEDDQDKQESISDDENNKIIQSIINDNDIIFNTDKLKEQGPDQIILNHETKIALKQVRQEWQQEIDNNANSIVKLPGTYKPSKSKKVQDEIARKLLDFMNEKHGKATSSQIIEYAKQFKECSDNPILVKNILINIAVLNKKTRIWHLLGKYRKHKH